MEGDKPIPGAVYLHYKGGLYRVTCLASMEKDLSTVVVYRKAEIPGHKSGNWVRTLEDWNAEVMLPDGRVVRRFSEVK